MSSSTSDGTRSDPFNPVRDSFLYLLPKQASPSPAFSPWWAGFSPGLIHTHRSLPAPVSKSQLQAQPLSWPPVPSFQPAVWCFHPEDPPAHRPYTPTSPLVLPSGSCPWVLRAQVVLVPICTFSLLCCRPEFPFLGLSWPALFTGYRALCVSSFPPQPKPLGQPQAVLSFQSVIVQATCGLPQDWHPLSSISSLSKK